MSATQTTARPAGDDPADPADPNPVVGRFLDAVLAGAGVPADLYADDAVLDATVPGWRFGARGPAAIVGEYAAWFDAPSRFEELDRQPFPGGEVVTYLQLFEVAGTPHAAHHCHLLRLDGDRIVSDTVFCGGRWSAERLAQMAEASHAC
jgi:hypothetical protein